MKIKKHLSPIVYLDRRGYSNGYCFGLSPNSLSSLVEYKWFTKIRNKVNNKASEKNFIIE